MNITYEDDGKGKHQSVTAYINMEGYLSMSGYEVDARGYGKDKEQAMINLSLAIDFIKNDIAKIKYECT